MEADSGVGPQPRDPGPQKLDKAGRTAPAAGRQCGPATPRSQAPGFPGWGYILLMEAQLADSVTAGPHSAAAS